MDRVIVGNIPSSNRKDFGYRSLNTSESHNQNQNEMLDDILDLYNKTNEIERVVKENADFIKMENTHLESVNHALVSEYRGLLDGYNQILNGETVRKKVILPKNCKVDDKLFGAIVSDTTNDITVRPSRKISKLAVFDSITDGMYLPDTLEVDIRCQTVGVISETDNDIYAPFSNDNELYWTRKVVTDNTCEEVKTEYVVNLSEEIMTTAEMNEIVIHPFLCNVLSVYLRYGDSNPWEKVYGIEHHSAINYSEEEVYKFSNAPRPLRLNFRNTKANQMKIVLKSKDYIEGETNLRNFMFGLKHVGAYVNYYNTYDASHFNSLVKFEEKDSILIEGFTFNFNNEISESRYVTDIDYEFYYRDEYGALQKIFEEFPFVTPSNELLVKFRIGEKYKDMNIRSIDLKYRALIEDYAILISHMPNIRIDYKDNFNLYYTVKASDSNTLVELISHELSLDDGITWIQMGTKFDGLRYVYEHTAFNEVCVKDKCLIRVTDFDGRIGLSNKFRISSEQFDKPPLIDFIDDITVLVNEPFQIVYRAGDDYAITKHEFSDSNGETWREIEPTVSEETIRGLTFKTYTLDLTYDQVTHKKCLIRLSDGVNLAATSNMFNLYIRPVLVTGLILDKYSIEINRGTTHKLNHTILPLDASDQTVIWETENEAVATVDDFGLVTAIDKRRCNVLVRTPDRKHQAVCSVTVLVPVEDVVLNANSIIMYVGEEFDLVETVLPIDADNKRVTWSITNSCASIDENGKVTAKRPGTCIATVTTEDGSHKENCAIEVRIPVSGIELNKKSIVKKVGTTEQLVGAVIPNNAFNKKVYWESTDSFIASVSNSGLVSANSPGKVLITARTDQYGYTDACEVEVLIPVNDVTLNKNELRLPSDESERLIATVMPFDAHDKSVTWKSSRNNIASVDENGLVVPSRSVGQTIITVTTNDGGYTDECVVTVYNRISSINVDPQRAIVPLAHSKNVNISFGNWASTTVVEDIIVENLNEDLFSISRVDSTIPFDTSRSGWSIRVQGLALGEGRIRLATTDGRIETFIDVKIEKALEGITYTNADSIGVDPDGGPSVANFLVPVGFIRTARYEIQPDGCEFHLGNLDRGYLDIDAGYHTKYDFSRRGEVDISIPQYRESYESDPYYRNVVLVGSSANVQVLRQTIKSYSIIGSMDYSVHEQKTDVKVGDIFTLSFKLEPNVSDDIKDQFRLRENIESLITRAKLPDEFYDGRGAHGLSAITSNATGIKIIASRVTKNNIELDIQTSSSVNLGEHSAVIRIAMNSFNLSYDYKFAYKFNVIE